METQQPELLQMNHITQDDIKLIVNKYGYDDNEVTIDNYVTCKASNKMLGFLSDYWKLKVEISLATGDKKVLTFFIKAISKTNAAKANIVNEMKLFQKETFFYSVLKERLEIQGMKPWSARFITALHEAIVFEDLNTLHYRTYNKFERFDTLHTLRALEALARFHASSIVLEEKKSKVLGRPYVIQDEFEQYLDKGGYTESDVWFKQCAAGALDAVKMYSKYNTEKHIKQITRKWNEIWNSALNFSNCSDKYRNVVCHRDLWNNNILFRYQDIGEVLIVDDCVLVDFQAVRCQPPAGDVMLLLYCNLDPKFREQNMTAFLNHYYKELKNILKCYKIHIEDIMTRAQYLASAEEQRQWALIVCACLIPQFWIDEDLTTEIVSDSIQFENIFSKDKASFIMKMMQMNTDYREKVMEIFDEIVERYILDCSH